MARVLVIQQVPHEGLGTFAPPLAAAGCAVTTLLASAPRARWPAVERFDGIVLLGGPMGVAEQAHYPFLRRELALIGEALSRHVATGFGRLMTGRPIAT